MPAPSTSYDVIADGFPTGLVGTLGVTIYAANGSTSQARATSGISEIPGTGVYRKAIMTPAVLGTYFVVWDDAGSPPLTATEELVVAAAPAAPPEPGPPGAGGPCTPWITPDDLACVITDPPAGSVQAAVDAATAMLYEASGRRYRGVCSLLVRPCRHGWSSCWTQQLTPTTIIGDWTGDAWDGCGCQGRQVVQLAGVPVRSITSVTIDGNVVPPDAYRLEPLGRLVRNDGAGWPFCQNMAVEPGAPGSFVVSYSWGLDAPPLARQAAAVLACELWAAQHNVDVCRLPSNITELVRQGVTIRRAVQAFNLANGATGLSVVDAFLGSQAGRPRRGTVVYSEDLDPYPRQVL